MTQLWTPTPGRTYRAPKVSREDWAGMLAWEAQVKACMEDHDDTTRRWTLALRKLDGLLELRRAKPLARAPGVLPGFYHLIRPRDVAKDSFMMVAPLTGPDGSFAEPTDAMLQGLRAADLQNRRAVEDRQRRAAQAAHDEQRKLERDADDRRTQIREGVDAITRTQVSMSEDIPWAQNHAGTRRPTRGRRG